MVDFLRGQCPIDKVTGILVFNGHRYLFTEKCDTGFINYVLVYVAE